MSEKQALIDRAINLFNDRAITFDEFNDLWRIIEKHEDFATKFITTIERVSKKTKKEERSK